MFKNLLRDNKGAALLEYTLLAAGVALVSAAAVSVFGHKTSELLSSVATILPGVHGDDNGPITSGALIETTGFEADGDSISLDVDDIVANSGTSRLSANLGIPGADVDGGGLGALVLEVE